MYLIVQSRSGSNLPFFFLCQRLSSWLSDADSVVNSSSARGVLSIVHRAYPESCIFHLWQTDSYCHCTEQNHVLQLFVTVRKMQHYYREEDICSCVINYLFLSASKDLGMQKVNIWLIEFLVFVISNLLKVFFFLILGAKQYGLSSLYSPCQCSAIFA